MKKIILFQRIIVGNNKKEKKSVPEALVYTIAY